VLLELINEIAAYVKCMKWLIKLGVFGVAARGRIAAQSRCSTCVFAVDDEQRRRDGAVAEAGCIATGLVNARHNPSNNKPFSRV